MSVLGCTFTEAKRRLIRYRKAGEFMNSRPDRRFGRRILFLSAFVLAEFLPDFGLKSHDLAFGKLPMVGRRIEH